MKKLLTIVAVALILCLGLSVIVSASGETHSFRPVFQGNARLVDGIPVIDDKQPGWETALLNPENWKFVSSDTPDLPGSDEMDSGSVVNKLKESSLLNLFVASANAEEDAVLVPVVNDAYILESTRHNHGKPTIVVVTGENGYSAEAYVWLLSNMHNIVGKRYLNPDDNNWCYLREECTVCGLKGEWLHEDHDPTAVVHVDGMIVCTDCGKVFAVEEGHFHVPAVAFEDMPTCMNDLDVVSYLYCTECYRSLKKDPDANTGLYMVIEGDDPWAIPPQSEWLTYDTAADLIDAYVAVNPYDYDLGIDLEEARLVGDYDNEGHLWGPYVHFQDATCAKAGRLVRICWLCETTQEMWDPDDPALLPDFSNIEIDCNSTAEITLKCSRCDGTVPGHTVVLENGVQSDNFDDYKDLITLKHKFDFTQAPDIDLPATCTTPGMKQWKCLNVGCATNATHEVYFAELGHDWDNAEWVEVYPAENGARGMWSRRCPRCNTVEDYFGFRAPCTEHVFYRIFTAPTCTEPGMVETFCENCDWYEVEMIDPIDHIPGDYTVIYDADCYTDGLMVYQCTMCGNFFPEVIPALNHPEEYVVETEAIEPTCSTPGCTEGLWCTLCESWVVEPDDLGYDPDNHEDLELVHATEPTCTEPGQEIWICNACHIAEIIDLEQLEHDFCYDEEDEEHYVVIQEPTTEEEGIIWHYCENGCGEYEEEIIPVLEGTPYYEVNDFVYDVKANLVTGTVEHISGAELDEVYVRISLYYTDNTWQATVVRVNADGSFRLGTNADCKYVYANVVEDETLARIPQDDEVFGFAKGTIIKAAE